MIVQLEKIWKELRRWMTDKQGFLLLLLVAFSYCCGKGEKDSDNSVGEISQRILQENLSEVRESHVRESINRLCESINWKSVETENVQRLLMSERAELEVYINKGGAMDKIFMDIIDIAGKSGIYAVTPCAVRKLIADILGQRSGSSIADMCCGCGGLGIELWKKLHTEYPYIGCYGEEREQELCDVASLCYYISNCHTGEILERDILANERKGKQVYDLIVMDVPQGSNVTEVVDGRDSRLHFFDKKNIYADWIFVQDALHRLQDKGSAGIIVTPGTLMRENEKYFRKKIIENDWLEAVITLPNNLYTKDYTGRELMVINKNKVKKEQIIFIDISRFYEQTGKNYCVLTEEGIQFAEKAFGSNQAIQGISAICDNTRIIDNDYMLKPKQYIRSEGEKEFESEVTLGEIADIVRGAQTLKKADVIADGNVYYINIKTIQNQRIDYECADRIAATSSVCKKKYQIFEDDILLTTKGTILKAAVVEKNPPEAYVSGNITIIRVDRTKYDPYVLYEYLVSEQGQIELERIQSGTTIKILSNARLKQLKVPDYNLTFMRKIGNQLKENQELYIREKKRAETRFKKSREKLLQELEEVL